MAKVYAQTRKAWALLAVDRDRLWLPGVYYFGGDLPAHVDGNRTALWRTRREARAARAAQFRPGGFVWPRIVRVTVTIATTEEGK